MKISILYILISIIFISCVQDMGIEGRLLPYGSIDNKPVPRPVPENTIAQGKLKQNSEPLTKAMLERGHERYDIYCTPCHGLTGVGNGVIVERGFPKPSSFHLERLRMASSEYLFDVIKNGRDEMYGYADVISEKDIFAIVAYIRALQLSQNVHVEKLPIHWQKNILRELK